MSDEPQYYSVTKVAKMFDVKPQTVRNWLNEKRLKGVKLPGSHWRISAESVREFANRKYGDG